LTELVIRLPRLLRAFPAQIVIITALPDLYFDDDVREREANASFQRALEGLKKARAAIPVAIFTDAKSSPSPRRGLFQALIAQADHVLRFSLQEGTALALTTEKTSAATLRR
jgi:hypothetical protein